MKKIMALPTILLASFPNFARAACELNGEVVPCSEMPTWFWGLTIAFPIIMLLFFVFWLWMLIDAIKNQEENKLMWVLLIVFLNVLGAIIYYCSQKRKRA